MSEYILEVRDLKQHFPVRTGWFGTTPLKAVDGVSFGIRPGETLGLVGESGCGKTTVGRTILHLYKPTSGEVIYNGTPLTPANIDQYRKEIQIVFQDPYSSLNPRMTVADIVGEPLDIHHLYKNKKERDEKIAELLTLVGLNSDHARRYAHEFSGGQRQRVSIARALVLQPKVILCDEPVSALDVSIQSQILNLLKRLQKEMDLTYVFISHALNVVRHVSDRVCVMYLGQVVELADNDEIFHNLLHPYTKALFSAIPRPDPTLKRERMILQGDIPSPKEPPAGCRFHTRCPFAQPACAETAPELREIAPGHLVRCHRAGEV